MEHPITPVTPLQGQFIQRWANRWQSQEIQASWWIMNYLYVVMFSGSDWWYTPEEPGRCFWCSEWLAWFRERLEKRKSHPISSEQQVGIRHYFLNIYMNWFLTINWSEMSFSRCSSLSGRQLCNGITKTGKACKKRAVLGQEYCRVHEAGLASYVHSWKSPSSLLTWFTMFIW